MSKKEKIIGAVIFAVWVLGIELAFFHSIEYKLF